MQWFKSAMVVSSAVFVAAIATNGCSSKPSDNGDGGDAKADVIKPPPPDGGGDGSIQCQSGLSCEQCDVTSYTPPGQPTPIGPHSGACNSTQITDFMTKCLSNTTATVADCQAWEQDTTNTTCDSCLVTSTTAANGGALLCVQGVGCSFNIPGCVDLALGQVSLENSSSNGSCGDYISAWYNCDDYACLSCEQGADGGFDSVSADACFTSADANECASYKAAVQSAANCNVEADVSTCFPADSNAGFTDTELVNFSAEFCGP
jgi:hypothetical protein